MTSKLCEWIERNGLDLVVVAIGGADKCKSRAGVDRAAAGSSEPAGAAAALKTVREALTATSVPPWQDSRVASG